ncbi:MAG: hypothetical protein D6776_03075 [Planctomycetota bacterium]|nr:MAG: hypothetical protein D6776_03075 [Planctomycetota bacterium]
MDALYFAFSAIAVYTALMMVTRRHPIYAAGWMLACLASVAGIFVTLHASFLGVIQVLLYAGAILVLFLFVIMLLNPSKEELEAERVALWQPVAGLVLGCFFAGLLVWAVLGDAPGKAIPFSEYPAPDGFGSTTDFGATIYDRYVVAFELISVLIIAAIAAVILVGKRNLRPARPGRTSEPAPPAHRETTEEAVHA